ncbi:MAG: septal ring lytic transglycosylase RlpA family protein [Chitinophagaceae bacterium]
MNLKKLTFLFFTTFFLLAPPILFSQYKKIKKNTWTGTASYYSNKFNGRKTANGEIFSNDKLTCANNFLKLGTYIKVTNTKNNLSVVVKVNDRMNKKNKRLVDLSQRAAKELKFFKHGLGQVKIEVVTHQDTE